MEDTKKVAHEAETHGRQIARIADLFEELGEELITGFVAGFEATHDKREA